MIYMHVALRSALKQTGLPGGAPSVRKRKKEAERERGRDVAVRRKGDGDKRKGRKVKRDGGGNKERE